MASIHTQLIDFRSPEDLWAALEDFAATFDHKIHRRFAYIIFRDDYGSPLGFTAILNTPLFVPAVHPDTPKRDMVEILRMTEGHGKMSHGDIFVGADPTSPLFPYLAKRDFIDLGLTLHYSK